MSNARSYVIHRASYIKLEHLWILTTLIGILVFVNTHPIRPHDFWWHMAVGREIVSTGRIPTVDTFSQTMAGTPYPSYKMFWLADVILYVLYQAGGPALIVFAQALMVTATYALLLLTAYRVSCSVRAAVLSTLAAAAAGLNSWNVRPQTLAFPIAALFIHTVFTYRDRPRLAKLIIFPVGMAAWVNVHGTFPLGLFLIGAWLADELWRKVTARSRAGSAGSIGQLAAPALAFTTSLLACLLNPQGLGLIGYVSRITGNPIIKNLTIEWAPPTFETLSGQLFYGVLLVSIAVLAISRVRSTAYQLITFLALTVLGLKTLRGSVWYGLGIAPMLAAHLSDLGRQTRALMGRRSGHRTSEAPLLNVIVAILLGIAALGTLPWAKSYLPLPATKSGLISRETPLAATEFLLKEEVAGPLFHDMAFGSYLIWQGYPEYRVFVDPRIELYPATLWLDYITISSAAADWKQILRQYDIQALMLNHQTQGRLINAVQTSPRWQQIYEDDVASIFVTADS